MGSFGVHSFVIEYDDLKKICPDEIQAIENAKYFDSVGWANIGLWLTWNDNDQIMDVIHDAVLDDKPDPVIRLELTYENMIKDNEEEIVEDIFDQYEILVTNLKTSFNKNTGLSLYFDHYDEESGDRYDNPGDKDGCIFCVDGMVQLSPAGEKFKNIVTERSWTQFG